MTDQIIENQPISMQALAAQTGPTPIAAMANAELNPIQFAITKAEIDQQVATAKRYPRNITGARDNIKSLVTIDHQMSEECVYAIKRGGRAIRGPSIRLAEIIASQWGNSRYGARIVEVDRRAKTVVAEGFFHDLEQNVAVTKRITRNISTREGKLYNDDMITMTGNVAGQIALRNAILAVVPKPVWREAYEAAESVIRGDVETLVERRDKLVKAFAAWGVDPAQIVDYLGVNSIEEVSLDDIVTLRSVYSEIKDGNQDVDEIFPPLKKPRSTKPKKTIEKQLEAKSGDEKNTEPSTTNSTNEDKPKGNASGAPSSNVEAEAGESSQTSQSSAPAPDDEQESQDPPFVVARSRGREAAENGLSPRAIPPEYRDDDDNSVKSKTAWEEGFAARTAELNQEQE